MIERGDDLAGQRAVQIGDWSSWDSCSTYKGNDTLKGRQKPSFLADIEALEESLELLHKEVPAAQMPSRHVTHGSHEARVAKFENRTPELAGDLWGRVQATFDRYGWQQHEFGKYAHIEGVSFTHVPLNVMGRPYGGKNVERIIANEAACSIVFGHTHRRGEVIAPKIGIQNYSITVLN